MNVEFIMTGITPTEWDIAMGIDDDDDVDYESNDDAYGEL